MSVITELQSQALNKNPLLYLRCLDYEISEEWRSSDLPSLEFQLVLGHVSFLENLTHRRCVMFSCSRSLEELHDKESPVVIECTASCNSSL